MKRKNKIILFILCIAIIIFGMFFLRNKTYVQDDIIFFELLGKGKNKKIQSQETIYLKVDYKNLNFKNVNLLDTTNNYYKKIAPGTSGEFSIVLNSNSNLDYQIKFQSKTSKPENLEFSIKGFNKTYKDLEEIENNLKGQIAKNQEKKITICWKWKYETDKNQDIQDTEDGINLKNYNFTIYTIGGANET